MEQKKCTGKKSCGEMKNIDQFYKNKNKCKECTIEYKKQYDQEHKEEKVEYSRKYNEEHKEERAEYRETHKEEIAEYQKQYREEHKEDLEEYQKIYQEEHKEDLEEYQKKYREEHKDDIAKSIKMWHQEKMANDPVYKLQCVLRSHFYKFINGIEYPSQTFKDFIDALDYSKDELIAHIESQFPKYLDNNGKPWMTWKNNGVYIKANWLDNDSSTWVWHIDHEIPKAQLPFKSFEEDNFRKCWGLDNLRPYPAKLNIKEGNRRKIQ